MESKDESKFEGVGLGADDSFEFGEDGEEVFDNGGSGTADDNEFDFIVGALEEILMGGEFTDVQNAFFERHMAGFTADDENKVEYMGVFQSYCTEMEECLEGKLKERMPRFTLSAFESMLSDRRDEISGDIFDTLLSFSDFEEFKQQLLAYKTSRTGTGGGFAVQGLQLG